jgi:RNA polymerase sigma factor (sigma-70 family)
MQADEWQLLNDYVTRNSDEAFRALVDRYGGMVYHAALRRLGSPQTAQDVTQAVFIALARKAARISRDTALAGWLYRATHFAVANVVREDTRRRQREEQVSMNDGNPSFDESVSVWERVSPHLDQALSLLSSKDRDAVLIRFFDNKSHAELARILGTTEDAAKVRVSRAVAKLRLIFARQGIVAPTTALLAALSAFACSAAPVGLTTSVATVALAKGAGGSISTLTLAKGILKIMAWNKLKIAAAGAAAILFGAAVVTVATRPYGASKQVPASVTTSNRDRSTPKNTLRYLATALDKGDAQSVAEGVQLGDGTDPQAPAAISQVTMGQSAFKRALVSRFGGGNADQALQNWRLITVPTEGLEKATEQIEGDAAVVQVPGKRPLRFARANDGWRLNLSIGTDAKSIAQFNSMGTLMLEVASELDAGKFGSSEEAFRSLQARIMSVR